MWNISYEGGTVPTIERTVEINRTCYETAVPDHKSCEQWRNGCRSVKKVQVSALVKKEQPGEKENGSYDFSPCRSQSSLVQMVKRKCSQMRKGMRAVFPLPYGTYIVQETTTPHNYKR